jgi:hypothetical protein
VDYRLDANGTMRERRSQGQLNPDTGLIEARLRWLKDGEQTDIGEFRMRICSRDELVALVEQAGLVVEAVYADFSRTPWTADNPREIVLLARKPKTP